MHPLVEKVFLVSEPFTRKYGPGMAMVTIVISIVPVIAGVIFLVSISTRNLPDEEKNGESNVPASELSEPNDVPLELRIDYLEKSNSLLTREVSLLDKMVVNYEEEVSFLSGFIGFLLIAFGCVSLSAGVVLLKLAEVLRKMDRTSQSDLPTSSNAKS